MRAQSLGDCARMYLVVPAHNVIPQARSACRDLACEARYRI